jgi:hypothetical protein
MFDTDDTGLMEFLSHVLEVLEKPSAPPASMNCEWCRYPEQS